jgi:elongation factor Tu
MPTVVCFAKATCSHLKMIAPIKLNENGRKTPFYTGYRLLFNFINNMKTSGQINLIHQDQFNPGEDGAVEITFLNQNYLGEDFEVGKTFFFGAGMAPLGEGGVKAIL